jgi:hypothetical protein
VNTYGIKHESILQGTIKGIRIVKNIWWKKKKKQ